MANQYRVVINAIRISSVETVTIKDTITITLTTLYI